MTALDDLSEYVDILGPDDTAPVRGRTARPLASPSGAGLRPGRRRQIPAFIARPYALIRAIPDVGTYAGVSLLVIGFVLLAVCWGKVAGVNMVGLQMPYLASAGLTGLGLIVTGIAVVSAASREKDAKLRRTQAKELSGTLREIRMLLSEPAPQSPPGNGKPPQATAGLSDTELTAELVAIVDAPGPRAVKAVRRSPRTAGPGDVTAGKSKPVRGVRS